MESKRRYGAPKVYHKLLKHGIKVSLKLVQRLMNEMGLFSIVVKKWRATKNVAIDNRNFPNLLGQDFAAISPNQKWAADMTYIYTKRDGWCYLATIQDLYSRKIIAHQLSRVMTAELVTNVLKQACETRQLSTGLILHTDLGSQYRSQMFENELETNGIKHSYSKRGCPYDNAILESFHASLKKEEVYQNRYSTVEVAHQALFSYIEGFYNRRRIHGGINYKTPNEMELIAV